MAELFKFRCYQCSKLLGASLSKSGTIVKCPKCGVELVVPPPPTIDQEEAAPIDEPGTEAETGAVRLEDLGLRLEPEPDPEPKVSARPVPSAEDKAIFQLLNKPRSALTLKELQFLVAPRPAAATPELDIVLPPASPEPSKKRRSRATTTQSPVMAPRRNDVILPRTAVVAWSMAMLLAIGFTFAAGMLIGHYLWRS